MTTQRKFLLGNMTCKAKHTSYTCERCVQLEISVVAGPKQGQYPTLKCGVKVGVVVGLKTIQPCGSHVAQKQAASTDDRIMVRQRQRMIDTHHRKMKCALQPDIRQKGENGGMGNGGIKASFKLEPLPGRDFKPNSKTAHERKQSEKGS
eukprot:5521024-Amphidinium_carterae.1